jgi:pSer/pThr/pTyr-binding forkhead associated (FHA) protein
MSARVILTAMQGTLQGRRFVFTKPTKCDLGRAPDCNPRFPTDWAHWRISRHHCQLLIDPPLIRVRDLGSLNGTFVNGCLIGQRDSRLEPDEYIEKPGAEHELHDGDELTLGDTTLRVSIAPAPVGKAGDAAEKAPRPTAQRAQGPVWCDC